MTSATCDHPADCETVTFSVGGFHGNGRPVGCDCGTDRTRAYQTYRHFAELPGMASVSLWEHSGGEAREIEAWAAE